MLQQAFNSFVEKNKLIPGGKKPLLAVSGGIDSVVMVYLFHLACKEFAIAHCNFKLRGEDSDKDEVFVKKLAETFSVPFFSTSFNTLKQTKQTGYSVQMTARELRYDWFEKIRKENHYDLIATAHHHDDNIETLLINLLRGTRMHGIQGIPLVNGNIIRPLLFAARKDIEQFAEEHNIEYREDISNKENKYARNLIRNEVFPLFERINPGFRDNFGRFFESIKLPYDCFLNYIEEIKNDLLIEDDNRVLISIKKLKELKYPAGILHELLKPYGFNTTTVEDIISSLYKQPGKKFYGQDFTVIKDRDKLVLYKSKVIQENRLQITDHPSEYVFRELKLTTDIIDITRDINISGNSNFAYLDYDKLKFPLTMRCWQNGDFFQPFGMRGKKKVSDFLIDNKVPLDKKESVHVICSGNDIVWVAGYRIDERFKIDKESRRCFRMHIK